jgi:hypothetical protein
VSEENLKKIPMKTNWLKYLICSHEYASDAIELSKICFKCGWHGNPYQGGLSKLLYRLDKRGKRTAWLLGK